MTYTKRHQEKWTVRRLFYPGEAYETLKRLDIPPTLALITILCLYRPWALILFYCSWSIDEISSLFVYLFIGRHPDVYKQQLTMWEAKYQV